MLGFFLLLNDKYAYVTSYAATKPYNARDPEMFLSEVYLDTSWRKTF
jgi:hypothetical protein